MNFEIFPQVTMASIFSSFCLNISAHFDIMQKIINDTQTKDFIIYHQTVLGISKKLIRLFKPIIFTEFVIMAIVLCFTGLQILMMDDTGKILSALLHAGAAFADVAIYSYGAQKVLDSALVVCDEFYRTDISQISFLEQFQVTLSRLFGRDLKAPIFSRTFQKKEEKNP